MTKNKPYRKGERTPENLFKLIRAIQSFQRGSKAAGEDI
jgi:hypothetical protein